MARDAYVHQLEAIAALAAEDLFLVVDDPAGTPLYKKATGTQLVTFLEAAIDSLVFSSTGCKLLDTGGDQNLTLKVNENLSANRVLSIVVGDGDRTIALAGDVSTVGGHAVELTTTGATAITLPESGTLATIGDKLSAFAATSSAELAGVVSDGTGTGSLVFADNPAFTWAIHDRLITKPRTYAGMVTFVSDDGWRTDYTLLKPLFSAKGVHAVTAITTSLVGTDRAGTGGFLRWNEILELQADGWEIAAHTHTHADPDITAFTDEQVRYEFETCNALLVANGVAPPVSHVWTNSKTDARVRRIARDYYRCAAGYGGSKINPAVPQIYNLFRVDAYDHTKLAEYQALVDEAKANGRWLIFLVHETTAAIVTMLGNLIDYIQAQGVDIVTLSEGLDLGGNYWDTEHFAVNDLGIRLYGETVGHLKLKPVVAGEPQHTIYGDGSSSAYCTIYVASTGATTLDAAGTSPGFRFSKSVGIGTAPVAGSVLKAERVYTDTSGALFGLHFILQLAPVGGSTAVLYSFAVYPSDSADGSSTDIGGLVGVFARPQVYHKSGTAAYVYGFQTSINFASTSAGTTTEVIGFLAGNPGKHASSTETIATCIGVKILTQTRGTTNWSLFAEGNSHFGNNLGIGYSGAFGTSATRTLAMGNGVAPSTSPADAFQMYSADQAAGNACPHIRTENGGIVKLYQQAAIADAAGGDEVSKINAILGVLRNAGLIAT